MSQVIEVAASILSADFAKLGEDVQAVDKAGADLIHLDVMDGHFVPVITFGPAIVKALRPYSKKPFDVHLMISPVDYILESFVEAGSDIITIHPEAGPHAHRTLQTIRKLGCQSGLSFNPGSDIGLLEYVIEDIDQILIMTVNPGFGGQEFIPSQLKKIEQVRQLIDKSGCDVVLEVDGGINELSAKKVIDAGATRLVAGTSVFRGGAVNYSQNISKLKN